MVSGEVVYIQPDRHNHRRFIYEHPDNYSRGSIARCGCGRYLTTKTNWPLDGKRWGRIYWWNLKALRNLRALKKPA